MSKIAINYAGEIKAYCELSGLSYDKLLNSPRCWDDEELIILYHDPKITPDSPSYHKPMPATLEIYLENGKLRFEQTDITHKYLGFERGTLND